MATNSLQSLTTRHRTPRITRRQSLDSPSQRPCLLTLNPTQNNTSVSISSAAGITFSLSSTSSTTAQSTASTFDVLERLLEAQDFQEADNETRRLLIALAGEGAQKRGYVFFSEVQFINKTYLETMDTLWRTHSNNKFGYSVQKRIWEKVDKDFTRFFIKVGWMKKLDTEVVQYNYKAFPDEFIWELNDETPEGHLPLTNALRGTQLLGCILSHPAFAGHEDETGENEEKEVVKENEGKESKVTVGKGLFKTNYSF
ncbi:tetrapyrrole-binding protein, chloroplastic-like [Bidens hawaiensis]|uniref:tetrapyrrole-binding protein, chloroplastic-like n=1 Tax=Bidens hawaiensis TaxID=980011 RepID=UPI0040499E21